MKLRHIVTMLLCLLLTAAMGIPALADAIFEPRDSFYANNTKDCVYVSRSYTANGKSGAVDIVKEPGSAGKVANDQKRQPVLRLLHIQGQSRGRLGRCHVQPRRQREFGQDGQQYREKRLGQNV